MEMEPSQLVVPNRGPHQNVSGLMRVSSDFLGTNAPFAANYLVTAATPISPAPQSFASPSPPSSRAAVSLNIECSNCGTTTTSAWRRSADGNCECNACNLFFRKNGRKRPAWMRRDTIARRFRLSRCEKRAMETQGNSSNSMQIKRPVSRCRQNAEDTSKTVVTQNSALTSSDSNQSTAAQNLFVSNAHSTPQPTSPFGPSNMNCSYQDSPMMNYAAEQTFFNDMNLEKQANPSEVDKQPSSSKPSGNTFAASAFDVIGQQLMTAASSVPSNAIKQQSINEELTLTNQDSQASTDHHMKTYEGPTEYSVEEGMVNPGVIGSIQFESPHSEPSVTPADGRRCNDFLYSSLPADEFFRGANQCSWQENYGQGVWSIQRQTCEEHDEDVVVFESL